MDDARLVYGTGEPLFHRKMDSSLRKNGLTLVVVGLAFSAIAPLAGGLIESAAIRRAASPCAGIGALFFVYGCIQIAKAKGHPWYVGLLGFLSCLGLAVLLFVVPDKRRGQS